MENFLYAGLCLLVVYLLSKKKKKEKEECTHCQGTGGLGLWGVCPFCNGEGYK